MVSFSIQRLRRCQVVLGPRDLVLISGHTDTLLGTLPLYDTGFRGNREIAQG